MEPAPLPPNETARLAALRELEILDTPRERDFDDFTQLAAQLCVTPMALVTLVDENRQWFKSRRGFELAETPRELSFCAHAIVGRGLFEIPDAAADPRFARHPLVLSGELRFYAGAPLVTAEGHAIGTLSVLDSQPRTLTPQQGEGLAALARQAMRQIELRRASRRLKQHVRCREFEATLGRALLAAHDVDAAYDVCVRRVARLFERNVGIWSVHRETGELHPQVRAGRTAESAEQRDLEAGVGRSAVERVVREKSALVVEDLERWAAPPGRLPDSGGPRLTAFAGFPVFAQTELLAVMALWGGAPLAEEEIAALSSVATTLGLAVDARRGEEKLRLLNQELERRAAERASAWLESERRHRTLLSNLPGMAYRCRNEPAWPIEYVSEGARALLGLEPEMLLSGRIGFDELIHPDDAARVWQEVQAAVGQHKPFVLEYRMKHASGEWRWVWEHGRGIETEGSAIVSIEGFLMDITARKRGEHQALRTQRLESLGTLAGGVAHDLNNALAPILMGLELLRMQSNVSDHLIDTMMASARRGADMVRQLLMFARGAEGARRLLQPQHLLAEMERIVRGTFPKHVELRIERGSDVRSVVGDPTQLHQVLLNLCVNARDAMPDGGVLTLALEMASIDASFASTVTDAQPGDYVVWRVTDTGTGIPPEIIERIFEPFFTTKAPDKGTGLGLSTVMGIVRAHGGFVRVESQPGQGTTFFVFLPAATASGAEIAEAAEPTLRGNSEVVLVVDDDPAVRHVSQSVLTALNFRVVLASDGPEALLRAAAYKDEVRVVITDLNMPHLNGLAFAHVIRRLLPGAGIIVASGRLDEHTEREFRELGVAAILHKPFGQDRLVGALRAAMACEMA